MKHVTNAPRVHTGASVQRSATTTMSIHCTYTAPACSKCYTHYDLMCHSLVPETARIGTSSAVVSTT